MACGEVVSYNYLLLSEYCLQEFNPLTDDKILALSKLKACGDDNLSVAEIVLYLFERVKNIFGKGENAVYQHFLLFP